MRWADPGAPGSSRHEHRFSSASSYGPFSMGRGAWSDAMERFDEAVKAGDVPRAGRELLMMQVWNTVAGSGARAAALSRDAASDSSRPWERSIAATLPSSSGAARENDIVVVSIFVNPSQFNDPSDLERYPRTFESDLALLREPRRGRGARARRARKCIRPVIVFAWREEADPR